MARLMIPARFPGGGAPSIQSMTYKTGESIVKGSVLVFDTGEVALDLTDPSPIVGVALEAAASKPGFEMSHESQVDVRTGRVQEVSVAIANETTIFSAGGSSDPVAANVGVEYDLAVASGVWTINVASTGATRVVIVDIDTDQNIFFFKFMTTHLALS